MILGVKELREQYKFSESIISQRRGKTKQSKTAFDPSLNIALYKYHQYHYHYRHSPKLFELFFSLQCVNSSFFLYPKQGNKFKIVNPLTPMNYQDRISPHCTNTISSRQYMRITRNINWRIISLSSTKFFKLTSPEL